MVRSHGESVRMMAELNGKARERRICCKNCGRWLLTTRLMNTFTIRKRQPSDDGLFIYCRHCKTDWLLIEENCPAK